MWSIAGARKLVQRVQLWSSHGLRGCATTSAAEPSKVLHVRTLGKSVTEDDLLELTKPFGSINKFVQLRTAPNQALLEMQDVSEAANIVQHYSTETPRVRGKDVFIAYSEHQELKHEEKEKKPQTPSKVLLVTIRNPIYEITTDVLEKVFNKDGEVEKIVIFQRAAGLQALIQFSSDDTASEAKSSFHGRQVYDGCCELDIQFSKVTELEVRYNNEYKRDLTNESLPKDKPKTTVTQSILGPGALPKLGVGVPGMNTATPVLLPPGMPGALRYNTVLLVSNLNSEKLDEDKLFNLFSGYGRVLRVKIFASKPDQALVQMADGLQAELAQGFLKGALLYGKAMEVTVSKNSAITHPDTRDYTASPRNRFNPDYIKHCCQPTKILHVSNVDSDVEQAELIKHLASGGGMIQNVKLFDSNGSRKQALCEFTTPEEATEALVCKHLTRLKSSTIRLAFSRFHEVL